MNLGLEEIKNIDIKSVAKKTGTFLEKNRFVVSSVILLAVTSIVLVRINSLIRPEIDQEYLEAQTQTQQEIEFADEAIEQLKQLNDSRIEIESQFTDRNNPFSDPN